MFLVRTSILHPLEEFNPRHPERVVSARENDLLLIAQHFRSSRTRFVLLLWTTILRKTHKVLYMVAWTATGVGDLATQDRLLHSCNIGLEVAGLFCKGALLLSP